MGQNTILLGYPTSHLERNTIERNKRNALIIGQIKNLGHLDIIYEEIPFL